MIWSQLPNQIPIHFNIADQADNFQPKPLVVFGLPIFDLMVHLFMIFMMGNYMPKLKVNHTVGIRLPWTLQSEDNWHKTHRFAGKLWVLGGLILLLEAGLQFALSYVLVLVILAIVLIPILYSYQLSRKNR